MTRIAKSTGLPDRRAYGLKARHLKQPDFVPSLRILIEEQEYSATDVGMMFGVSRERVRQWANKFGIEQKGRRRQANSRRWNDETNRFEPGWWRRVDEAEWKVNRPERKRQRQEVIAQVRQGRVAAIHALAERLGRLPTNQEMATELVGRPISHMGAAPSLCYWFGLPSAKGSMAIVRRMLGWEPRKAGRPRKVSR